MSKQTAVDVYHAQIKYLIKMGLKLSEPDKTFLNSAYRDCKVMEREQIEGAYIQGCLDEIEERMEFCVEESCKRYYNETYKGE